MGFSGDTALIDRLYSAGADVSDLKPSAVRPELEDYTIELFQRRHFIWQDSRSRARAQFEGTLLGRIWFFLMPLIDAAFYWFVFGILLGVSRGMDNFVAFVIIGVLMFRFTSHTLTSSTNSLRGARAMIRAFSFPRASIPISAALRELISAVPMVAVMFIMIMALPPHTQPATVWLLFPVVFVLQILMNTGLALWLARIGHAIPDSTRIISVAVRFLMYGSGVIFPIDRFLVTPLLQLICELNPIFQMLRIYRSLLIDGTMPHPFTWAVLSVWTVGLCLSGYVFFWRGEPRYVR